MLTLPDDYLREHIKQAERSGYKAFVITIDQSNVPLSRKNSQIAKMGVATFPLFKPPPSESVVEKNILDKCFSHAVTREKIDWIHTLTSLPIVIKGILTTEDAIEATKHHVSAIIVSNHGGRQLDSVPATVKLQS